jgi:hypothetical protein
VRRLTVCQIRRGIERYEPACQGGGGIPAGTDDIVTPWRSRPTDVLQVHERVHLRCAFGGDAVLHCEAALPSHTGVQSGVLGDLPQRRIVDALIDPNAARRNLNSGCRILDVVDHQQLPRTRDVADDAAAHPEYGHDPDANPGGWSSAVQGSMAA